MNTQVKHIPTGLVYENRKEAKHFMGHSNYNKAIRLGQMMFVTSYGLSDIII